jgi:hypothetical protein
MFGDYKKNNYNDIRYDLGLVKRLKFKLSLMLCRRLIEDEESMDADDVFASAESNRTMGMSLTLVIYL